MKKLFMVIAAMLLTLGVSAQHAVGSISLKPMVGMTVANMTNGNGAKAKIGLTAGVEAEYQISEMFGISAGAIYSMEGCKGDAEVNNKNVTEAKLNNDYINVPILANVYVAKGLALKAGIQPGFMVRSKVKVDGDNYDSKDMYNKVDFSIPVGASYEYENFVLDARYNIGLTKVFKSEYDVDSKNSVFMFTIGYKFDL